MAPSPYIQNELIRSGIPKEKISCVFNPIAEAAFVAPLKDKPEEKFDVLFAGRISPEKGVFNLIEAAKLLPNIRFGIVGNGPDRDRLIESIKTVANVQYLGFVSNARVNELIQSSRLSVLPSVCNEVLPTFVLESFMQGKHCVVPSLESTRWLVEDGYPGYSAATESPAAIATAISESLEKPIIPEETVTELRDRFGIVRFCTELNQVAVKVRAR